MNIQALLARLAAIISEYTSACTDVCISRAQTIQRLRLESIVLVC